MEDIDPIPELSPFHTGHDVGIHSLAPHPPKNPPRHPLWIFGITSIPYGMATAFAIVVMPYLLRKEGISVSDIGWYTTLAMAPSFLQFVYTPIVDVWLRRRTWLIILTLLGALCFSGACFCLAGLFFPERRITICLILVFLGQVFAGLTGSCNGGLLATTVTEAQRGRAGGFYNAGNLGGGAISAGVILLLTDYLSLRTIGALWTIVMILPALAALVIDEPAPLVRSVREVFRTMIHEVVSMVKSHAGWMGLLFCLSPVGTVALTNCFSALSVDYKAKPWMVAFVNGALSGLVSILGSLVGGYVSDRMNRRYAYLLSGLLTVFVSVGMAVGPLSPVTYVVGVTVYLFVAGFAYSTYSAVVLESLGKTGQSASTQYALFLAVGNLAITYVGLLNTRFHRVLGPRSVPGTDAILNLAGVIVLGIVVGLTRRRKARGLQPQMVL